MVALKANFIEKKRIFEIKLPNKADVLKIGSSGLFDNKKELMSWAERNGGQALGYIDGSENHEYILVDGQNIYDVEVDEK